MQTRYDQHALALDLQSPDLLHSFFLDLFVLNILEHLFAFLKNCIGETKQIWSSELSIWKYMPKTPLFTTWQFVLNPVHKRAAQT